jgi:hypothetical protein
MNRIKDVTLRIEKEDLAFATLLRDNIKNQPASPFRDRMEAKLKADVAERELRVANLEKESTT